MRPAQPARRFQHTLPLAFASLLFLSGACGGREAVRPPSPPQTRPDYRPANPRLGRAGLMADLEALASPELEGRLMGSDGNAKARAYIVQRFRNLGLDAWGTGFEQPFSSSEGPGVNIIARVPGTRLPERVILITSHYDHIGYEDGEVVCGADDNASGTAAILQMAAWVKAHPPARTVAFGVFDGEEEGLLGSEAFADQLQTSSQPFALPDIDVVLNLDMIAQGTRGRIFVGGTTDSPDLKPFLLQAYAGRHITVIPDSESYDDDSDQGPFWHRGVPFLFFCVADDDPYCHTPDDTFAHIPQDFYWGSTEAILETFLRLDAAPDLAGLLPRPAAHRIQGHERTWRAHPWNRRGRRLPGP